MKEKTKKRINIAVIWVLVFVFAASGFLLYLPTSGDTTTTPPATQSDVAPEPATTPQP